MQKNAFTRVNEKYLTELAKLPQASFAEGSVENIVKDITNLEGLKEVLEEYEAGECQILGTISSPFTPFFQYCLYLRYYAMCELTPKEQTAEQQTPFLE